MRALFAFLFTRKHALIGFLLLKTVAVVVNGLVRGTAEVWGIGILALMVYGIIARFARAGRVLSIWAVTILMLYEAAGALLAALSGLGSAPATALIGLAAAAYLVVGALAVFASRREGLSVARIYGENVPARPAFPEAGSKPVQVADSGKGLLLYIHVPFCRSRCHYCSFHSQSFDQATFAWYLSLLLKEIDLWGRRLQRPRLRTVYFGGGTPSLIPLAQLDRIMKALDKAFVINQGIEATIEANPDSAQDASYFRGLLSMGFNRLSLGMQSLKDADLQTMGRPHSVAMAYQAFDQARRAGFGNIGLDLIWGLPGQKLKVWLDQLRIVSEMRPEHISAYNLTLEEGTVMARRCGEGGDLTLPLDQEQGRMFVYGAEYLESVGYLHYEVSNFARMGFTSVHNSGYWDGSDYLGLGPSAVSTLGRRRFTVPRYMDEYDAYVRGELVGSDYEELTDEVLLEEMVMLSLRTAKGLDLKEYRRRTGFDLVKKKEQLVSALHRENLVRISGGRLRLTKNGMLVSNVIIERLAFGD